MTPQCQIARPGAAPGNAAPPGPRPAASRAAGYPAAGLTSGRPVTSVVTCRLVTLSGPRPDSASVTRMARPGAAEVDSASPTAETPASQDGMISVTSAITLALARLDRARAVRLRVSGSSSVPRTRTRSLDAATVRTVSARSDAA